MHLLLWDTIFLNSCVHKNVKRTAFCLKSKSCYIINILTVTFDQFNVSLQNIIFFFWTAVFNALMSGGYVAHCGVLGVKLPV